MNTRHHAAELFRRYREGIATAEEIELIESWHLSEMPEPAALISDQERSEDLADIRAKLVTLSAPAVKMRRWPRLAAVAAAAAAILLGLWVFTYRQATNRAELSSKVRDIAPARQGATLTLANGQVIRLSNNKTGVVIDDAGKMKYNDGSELEKLPAQSSNRQMVTARAARGQVYSFQLPDGSKIWLNAGSALSFPTSFAGLSVRKVQLHGEAYFEIAQSYTQPFRVESREQQVDVLGTHFNLRAYEDEIVATTLLEGSVKVSPANHKPVILKPSQQAVLTSSAEGLLVRNVDVQQEVAWKDGLFMYSNTTLEEVMREASRWYDVEVRYEKESLKQKKLSGSVTRYDNLSALLKAISYTTGVKFKLEARTLTIYD